MKTKVGFRFPWKLQVIVLLITCSVFCSAQDDADSLRRVAKAMDDNNDKVTQLIRLGDTFRSFSHDSALFYYSQANALAEQLNYPAGIADSWFKRAMVFYNTHQFDSSAAIFERYIDIAIPINDSFKLAKGFYFYGSLMLDTEMDEVGINYFKKSLVYLSNTGDTIMMLANFNQLGNIFKNMSEYDSAAFYYLKGLALVEKSGDEYNKPIFYNNLGDVYLNDGQFETAGKYYKMALDINTKYPDRAKSVALNYNNLGRLASAQLNFKEAIGYYDNAIEISLQLNDSLDIFHVYNNYGDLYYKQDKFDAAIPYFEKALNGYVRLDYLTGVVVALGNLASVYIEQGKFEQGMALHDSCLNLTYRIGNKDLRMDAYWGISLIFNETGKYKLSREYLLKYTNLKDSIYSLKKSKFTNDLVVKYEKEQDQARILNLEKENLKKTIQRNSILYSGLGLMLLAIFIILFFRQRAAKDKIIAHQKIRQLEEEKKLMVAKMMIEGQEEERKRIARELHDGLGVLLSATKMQFTAIKDISPENRPMVDKALQLLEQASGDVRKISHNMMPGLLTKLGFFEAVEDLFDNLNDTGNMKAILKINGSQERLPENREIMLYRIVQEMINNTLKYAEASKIKLIINVMTEHLTMVFADDGKGFDVEKVLHADSESLGLKSIQSRVNFLNGEVSLESRPGEGVKYSFRVPLN